MQTIGERVREARQKRGFSQATLGRRVRLSQAYVSAIESGLMTVPEAARAAFSRVLDIPVADLTPLDGPTLAVVEARLRAAGRCDRAVRLVQEMAGGVA